MICREHGIVPEFKVGDWVECKCFDGNRFQAMVSHDNLYEGKFIIEYDIIKDVSGRWSNHPESLHYKCTSLVNEDLSVDGERFKVVCKLDPSEVVVKIGCLSGTVERAQDYAYFLLWHSKTDCDYSMIKWSALDAPTLELVESLLKAQEEK